MVQIESLQSNSLPVQTCGLADVFHATSEKIACWTLLGRNLAGRAHWVIARSAEGSRRTTFHLSAPAPNVINVALEEHALNH